MQVYDSMLLYILCCCAGNFIQGRRYFPLHPIMDYFYVKPWVRIGPYLIGLSLSFALVHSKLYNEAHAKAESLELPDKDIQHYNDLNKGNGGKQYKLVFYC